MGLKQQKASAPGPRSALMPFLFIFRCSLARITILFAQDSNVKQTFTFFICTQVEQFSLAECAAVAIASYAASRLAVGVAVIIHHLSVGITMDIHTIAVDIGNLLEIWLAITIG